MTEQTIDAIIETCEKLHNLHCQQFLSDLESNPAINDKEMLQVLSASIFYSLDGIGLDHDLKTLDNDGLIKACNTATQSGIREIAQALNSLADSFDNIQINSDRT